jgi:hypothetical protein
MLIFLPFSAPADVLFGETYYETLKRGKLSNVQRARHCTRINIPIFLRILEYYGNIKK